MVGPFRADAEFAKVWEAWFETSDKARQELKSEVLQSILARKNTNTLKLAMVFSAAESSDRILRCSHWERALGLTDQVESTIQETFEQGKAQNMDTPDGMKAAIFREVRKGDLTIRELEKRLMLSGAKGGEIEMSLRKYQTLGILGTEPNGNLKLLVNSQDYF